jgi:hypothetical protein
MVRIKMTNHDFLYLLLTLPVFAIGFCLGWLWRGQGTTCPVCKGYLEHKTQNGAYVVRLPRQCKSKNKCLDELTRKEALP